MGDFGKVKTVDAWTNLTHLGNDTKMPLCGCKLTYPKLAREFRVNSDGFTYEKFPSPRGWAKVHPDNYCRRCLKVLRTIRKEGKGK